jgi:pSer/pThr/pTyr-binding forkhead associated (FHA) protein
MPELSLDWFLFFLRLAFILLLYVFLFQIVQVTRKELISRATDPGDVPIASRARTDTRTATLIIADPGSTGLPPGIDVPLAVITSIGRLSHNSVPLDDPSVSGEHAEITFVRDRWWVRDLGSTNGTLVNEERIGGPTPLRSGDVVQFGRVSGRFRV